MAKFPYTTPTGLVLSVKWDDGDYVLRLAGDRVKELGRYKKDTVMAAAEAQRQACEGWKTEAEE